ncbi:hypothetical protein C1H46_030598 [Malus baccata]|uniref:F-box associated beta-propeller type 3 domain-containing protein n=1 Tax=Malus baccata TaxID=106549 RepID=A0A540LBH9_MALBA|nr:hypothetical protein C1H46_030598 [Malus baccata]
MASSSPTLPSDVIRSEILTRISPETLGSCRLVSKEWYHSAYDSFKLFCEKTNTTYGFFLQSKFYPNRVCTFLPVEDNNIDNSKTISLRFLHFPYSIEAADRGLLVGVSHKNHKIPRYFVCAPTTQYWKQIPNPKTRYFTRGTAVAVLRSSSNSNPLLSSWFKIIRLSEPETNPSFDNHYICEVFDSNTWSWKQLNDVILPHGVLLGTNSPVSACCALYWHLTNNQILAFYQDKETWETFALPHPMCNNVHWKYSLTAYQGRLALVRKEGGDGFTEYWIMEDHREKIWSERKRLSTRGTSVIAFCDSDVALMKEYGKMIFYNFKECKVSKLVELESWHDPDYIFRKDMERGVYGATGDSRLRQKDLERARMRNYYASKRLITMKWRWIKYSFRVVCNSDVALVLQTSDKKAPFCVIFKSWQRLHSLMMRQGLEASNPAQNIIFIISYPTSSR